jgi:hypothetical protein
MRNKILKENNELPLVEIDKTFLSKNIILIIDTHTHRER